MLLQKIKKFCYENKLSLEKLFKDHDKTAQGTHYITLFSEIINNS